MFTFDPMARHKTDIPLVVIDVIEAFLKTESELYKVVDPGTFLAKIEAYGGKCFFVVKNYVIKNGVQYRIAYKPRGRNTTDEAETLANETDLKVLFDKWTELIKSYEKATLYDDPILTKYKDDFYSEFKIIEPGADEQPFDLKKQLLLDEYLEDSLSKISKMKEGVAESELSKYNDLEAEVTEIRNNLTIESKNKVVNRLARFWAKAQKIGLPVLKELFLKISVELAKRLLLGSNSNPE